MVLNRNKNFKGKNSRGYDEENNENELDDRNFIDMVTSKELFYFLRSLLQFKRLLSEIFWIRKC